MESTEKRIPEWAVKAADRFVEVSEDPDPLARLIASTRESALREAARRLKSLTDCANTASTTVGEIVGSFLGLATAEVLNLIDKEPSS